jgi:hypothetical protein
VTGPLRAALWLGGGVLFALLATANGAGYRYGASDQAYYVPAIIKASNPAAFPRDSALLDAQSRLLVIDNLLGSLVRRTGASIEAVCLGGYLLSLCAIWTGLVSIGSRLYRRYPAVLALAAAFTLRHQIPRTSANSFEPYFHPRMLAFGLGVLAIAALVRGRPWLSVVLVAGSFIVHVTTGLWIGILIGVALLVSQPVWRQRAVVVVPAAILLAAWTLTRGPLQGGLSVMDEEWQRALASKDTLFATAWPLWAWVANLALPVLLWYAYRVQAARGTSTNEARGLVWGALVLVALFVATLPLTAAKIAIFVQLQIPRIFWLVDLVATLHVVGAAVDLPESRKRLSVAVAMLLVALSAGRGFYIMQVERAERRLFAVRLPDSPWEDAMRWIARQPIDVHVLADPGHAWKYGASIRVSPARDVFLEDVKDAAFAIYSRETAARVLERAEAVGDFSALTSDRARQLAARYDLDYLVTPSELALAVAYRNEEFRVYDLSKRRDPDGRQAADGSPSAP